MKFFAVLTLAALAACVKSDKDMVMKVVEGCKTTVNASDDDLKKFMSHSVPDNQEQKCLFSCVMTGLKVIKDGKLNKPGYMTMVGHMIGADEAKTKLAAEIFDTCESISDPEACESALKIGICLKTEGEKKGIPIPI